MKKSLVIALAILTATACGNRNKCPQYVYDVPQYENGIAQTRTAQGLVEGYKQGPLYIFRGIRYAVAERFMPPVEPESWEGVRHFRSPGPMSPQGFGFGGSSVRPAPAETNDITYDTRQKSQSEDCLRLNIWTQGLDDGGKRPVMVWLHGGAFQASCGDLEICYDGSMLAKKGDVVVISINHRLNCVGYLDLSSFGEKYRYSGNVGIMDIVAALKWINANIEHFGGDPNNITIFGQSGGGGKVSATLAAPSSKGLVSRAIVESGVNIDFYNSDLSRLIGEETVRQLGIPAGEIDRIQTIPYEELSRAANAAMNIIRKQAPELGMKVNEFGWAPTVDGNFLPWTVAEALKRGVSADVPLMIGTTLNELVTVSPANRGMSMEAAREAVIKKYGAEIADEYIDTYSCCYPGFEPRDLIETDYYFRANAVREASLKAEYGKAPVYRYELNYLSPAQDSLFRCPHNMEIAFAFNNVHLSPAFAGFTEDSRRLNDIISDVWISFARDGKPYSKQLPEWPAFKPEEGATMIFNNKCEVRYNHDKELVSLMKDYTANPYF
ncbi:MAG: carboxylesterase family protein [Bacteroidales bacterium]|nr:carboxylesterase family protein [Bacteroidales bacterium]